jgi:hypothetical protein
VLTIPSSALTVNSRSIRYGGMNSDLAFLR